MGRGKRQRQARAHPVRRLKAAFALLLAVLATAPASAQDGGALFAARCASCHAIDAAAPEKPGPNLAGILGRPLAADPRFDYSPAMRRARAQAPVWDAERLSRFLEDPEAMVPGLWMGGNGLREAAERDAVVAFLRGKP